MHVCFITDEYPQKNETQGGIGTFVYTLAQHLAGMGIQVSVVGGRREDGFIKDGLVSVYTLAKSKKKYLRFVDTFSRLNKLIATIHQQNPIHVVEGSELAFSWIKKITGVAYVLRLHGGHYFFTKLNAGKFRRWTALQEIRSFKKADYFIGVSQFVLTQTAKYLPIPLHKATKIYYPIDCSKFYPANASNTIPFKIVFVGTLCEKKGIRQLVLAMPAIIRQFPQAQLHVYGRDWINDADGGSFKAYLLQIMDAEVKDFIHFKGAVSHDALPAIYEEAHICAFPSHMETQGIVVLEAMSMGKAVLFSTHGPGPETIEHLTDGILANPRSPADIAEKLIHFFSEPQLELQMGQAARAKILERYEVGIIAQKNIDFYQAILANKI